MTRTTGLQTPPFYGHTKMMTWEELQALYPMPDRSPLSVAEIWSQLSVEGMDIGFLNSQNDQLLLLLEKPL